MKDWTTERIRAASELLDEALELDVDARIDWLAALALKDRAVAADVERAKQRLEEAQRLLDSLSVPSIEYTASCMRAKSAYLDWSGEDEAAISQMKALVSFLETHGETKSARYAAALNDLGYFLTGVERPQDAIAYIERAGNILDQTGRSHSLMRIANLETEALALQRFGETKQSALVLTEAMKRQQGDDLSVPRLDSAESAQAYGLALERLADPRAESWLTHSINLSQQKGNESGVLDNRIWLAGVRVQKGKFAEAKEILDDVATKFGASPPTQLRAAVQRARGVRIELHIATRSFLEATEELETLFREIEYPAKKTSGRLPTALGHASELSLEANDPHAARRYANDLLEISLNKARAPKQSAAVGAARVLLARAALQLDDKALATSELEQALASLTNGLGESHPSTVKARELLRMAK